MIAGPEPPPDLADAPDAAPEYGEASASLDLEIAQQDIGRLLRAPALLSRRAGRARTVPANIIWHDTASGELALRHLALSQSRRHGTEHWRLEPLQPNGGMDWLPARTAPVLCEAASVAELRPDGGARLPAPLAPVAAFAGRLREFPLHDPSGPARLSVLEGTLRGVAQDRPACRVTLSGDPVAMADLAQALAASVRLTVPREGLAAQALEVARGVSPAPRHAGAPALPPDLSVGDALTFVCAHLADVILHWAARITEGGTPEPVHQMRVGVRRLRSALSVFRRAVQDTAGACPWLDDLADRLQRLAWLLGSARDWDVFLGETGADIRLAFAGERRVEALLAAATRKRAAAYETLADSFASRDWCSLEMTLALLPTLRPWQQAGTASEAAGSLARPVRSYAALALSRRARPLLRNGEDICLLPAAALHDARKQAKRLRYAIEFFAPLFAEKPVRKYLKRLATLQEILGALNDGTVAAGLAQQLGSGTDRAYAAGVVHGFEAARSRSAKARLRTTWSKFYRAPSFWD